MSNTTSLSQSEFLKYLTSAEKRGLSQLEIFFNLLSDDLVNEMKALLINGTANRDGYGDEEKWKTNHLKHLIVYQYIAFVEITRQFLTRSEARPEDLAALKHHNEFISDKGAEVNSQINSIKEVCTSTVSEQCKSNVKNMGIEQTILAVKDINAHLDQALKIKEQYREIEIKLKARTLDLLWIDVYLINELGSARKACQYVSEHPLLKFVAFETIHKAYIRYKKAK
jgi:hypothetical protein